MRSYKQVTTAQTNPKSTIEKLQSTELWVASTTIQQQRNKKQKKVIIRTKISRWGDKSCSLSVSQYLRIAEWASVICLTFSVGYWVFLVFTTYVVCSGTDERINMEREREREIWMMMVGTRKSVKSERRKEVNSRTQLLAR